MLFWLNSPQTSGRGFIFLDRDGVINEDRPDHVKNIREFRPYPDALEALEILNHSNIAVIIISNQSGINRGLISWDDFWEMHDGMIAQVERSGGKILAALYCPHKPDELCGCRKPSPGMILAACRLFGIDPVGTRFIGDNATDIVAAQNAGCRGVYVQRKNQGPDGLDTDREGTPVFSSLIDAVRSIYR